MRRVRVLQVISVLRTGGAERVVVDLLRHLDRDRFVVGALSLYPYSGSYFEQEAMAQGFEVHYLNKRPGVDLSCLFATDAFVRRWRPEVVHSHLYSLGAILPACLWHGVPARVHTVHCPANVEVLGWRRWMRHVAFHHLGVVPVSISHGVRQTVEEVYGRLESPVIHNAIDAEVYKPRQEARDRWRRLNGIVDSTPVIVCTASLTPKKNHALLIGAFREVVRAMPKALLLLVGDGPSAFDLVPVSKDVRLGIQCPLSR